MGLIDALSSALGRAAEEVTSALGLTAGAEEKEVAEAIMACAERPKEPEVREVLPAGVANALGVEPTAEEKDVRAKIVLLQAPGAGLMQVCAALGLEEKTELDQVLSAIGELQKDHRKNEAQALVEDAIEAGRVPPAQKEFWLNAAQADYEAAKAAIDALPPMLSSPCAGLKPHTRRRDLTEGENAVCRQLGLSTEAFLNAQAG